MTIEHGTVTRLGTTGPRVLMVHGSLAAGIHAFGEQKPLGERWRVELVCRRGYGERAPIDRVDIAVDAAELAELIGEGAHLVGTSMGGVVAMHAAALRPNRVLSLTLIEPPAIGSALDRPPVRMLAQRMRDHYWACRDSDPIDYARGFLKALEADVPLPQPTPDHMAKAFANLRTELPWRIDVPIAALADAPFPKLIVSGGWSTAFDAIAQRLAKALECELLIIKGAGHAVQRIGEEFNSRLEQHLAAGEADARRLAENDPFESRTAD